MSAGELIIDHRASPGIPEAQARKLGFDPKQVREGAVFEAKTYGCSHCGSVVVVNPLRTRERASCFKCNSHICDWCAVAAKEPGYVHRSFNEIADQVVSGRFALAGSMSRPIIKPIGGASG